ncbi:MAG: hypothetical protein KAX49_14455 [Halanaerobiales bacterium]|nr:hypothetical protein [Halanaerobiales bacterium]
MERVKLHQNNLNKIKHDIIRSLETLKGDEKLYEQKKLVTINEGISYNNDKIILLLDQKQKEKRINEVKNMSVKEIRKNYKKKYIEFIEERRATAAKLRGMVKIGKEMRLKIDNLNVLIKQDKLSPEDQTFLNSINDLVPSEPVKTDEEEVETKSNNKCGCGNN